MSKKKCSYCEATTYKSVYEAGWLAIDISIGRGENRVRFRRRSCPGCIDKLRQEIPNHLGDRTQLAKVAINGIRFMGEREMEHGKEN